ncbi:MAG: hypothetical protein ACLQLG_18115 [Thermoguttaceae bacterium]
MNKPSDKQMSKPINIDADLINADWPKRTDDRLETIFGKMGDVPVPVASTDKVGGVSVHDDKLWKEFIAKGKEK